jgi:Fur family transcriptional regulator, ferric uptake regulator
MSAKEILKQYQLSKTSGRLDILNVFLLSATALSEKDLQVKTVGVCDRATIYRTLKLFVKSGIIHPIATESMVTRYILKKGPVDHLHFKCEGCGSIICLPDIRINDYNLPNGFKKKEASLLITGICNVCNA